MKNLKKAVSICTLALVMLVSFNVSGQENKRVFTDEQIQSIGQGHNEFLVNLFKDFDWKAIDKIKALEIRANEIYSDPDKDFDLKKIKIISISDLKKLINNENDFKYFQNILNFNESIEDKNLSEIIYFVNNNIKNASNDFSSVKNHEAFLVFSSVYKNSAKFWISKDNGGMGKFDYFKEMERVSNSSTQMRDGGTWRECLRDVLVIDAGAVGGALLTGGIIAGITSAIINPWIFIARVVASAGWSSGVAYFQSDNC